VTPGGREQARLEFMERSREFITSVARDVTRAAGPGPETKVRRIRDVHRWMRRRPGGTLNQAMSVRDMPWRGIGSSAAPPVVLAAGRAIAASLSVIMPCRRPVTVTAARGRPLHGDR